MLAEVLTQIKQQPLGSRPRLDSIEVDEVHDKESEVELNQNADEPIHCLHTIDLRKYKSVEKRARSPKKYTTTDESMGFIPLSHTICNDLRSCSESSIDTDNPYENSIEEASISEGAAISLYKLSCEKMKKMKLFDNAGKNDLASFKESLKELQMSIDFL